MTITNNAINSRLAEIDRDVINALSSGILTGGAITINAGDPARFDIAEGTGYIIDSYTDPLNPTLQLTPFGPFIGVQPTNIGTEEQTFIAVDETAQIVQQNTQFSAEDKRDLISIGTAIHPNQVNIEVVQGFYDFAADISNQFVDLIDVLGILNKSGNIFGPNGVNLMIDKTSGTSFAYGANFQITRKSPNITDDPSCAACTFSYLFQDGSGGSSLIPTQTDIDPEQFDDGSGVLQTVPSNDFTIQRLSFFPGTTDIFVEYGQNTYTTLAAAKDNVLIEDFISSTVLEFASLRAFLIVQEGTTDLTDVLDADFITASNVGAGGGGSDSATLQSAYNNSADGRISLNSTQGSFKLKDNVVPIAQNLFEIADDSLSTLFISTDVDRTTIGNNFRMPDTTASIGVIEFGTDRFIHNFGILPSNTFVGRLSGNQTNTASGSVGLGSQTLLSLTSGTGNTCVGASSGNAVDIGTDNVFVGRDSGIFTTTGSDNVFIGSQAGLNSVATTGSIAIGEEAFLSGTANASIAIGQEAMRNFTGTVGIAIGNQSMLNATSGTNCTAIGDLTLSLNQGDFNSAYGSNAGQNWTTGDGNTFIGNNSALNGVSGASNTFLGSLSGQNVGTGSNNLLLGESAGLSLTLTDSDNIQIGNQGTVGDNATIRIGTLATHTTAYMQGIIGVTVPTSQNVTVDANGQLGTSGTGIAEWINVTGTSDDLVAGTGYFANNALLVTLLLPATANIGDTFEVVVAQFGLVEITQNANQTIIFGDQQTTVGVGGDITATNIGDSISVVAIDTNTYFVKSSIGNWITS